MALLADVISLLLRVGFLAPTLLLQLLKAMGNLLCLDRSLGPLDLRTIGESSLLSTKSLLLGTPRPPAPLLWSPSHSPKAPGRPAPSHPSHDTDSSSSSGDLQDGAASGGTAAVPSAVPSLMELCTTVVAGAFERCPPAQLSQLPGDLMQQVIDQLISSGSFSLHTLLLLGQPPDLDSIDLEGADRFHAVTDDLVMQLSLCPRLRAVDLSRCTMVTDRSLQALASRCSGLQHLRLNYCIQISDAAMQHLAGLVTLHTLELGGCDRLTADGLRPLSALSRLTSLSLNQCGGVKGGVEAAAGLPLLSRLDLGWCTALTDKQLSCLSRLTPSRLTYLDLSSTKVSEQGLAALSTLTSLQHLSLKGCSLTGTAGKVIAVSFGSLTRLDLDRCLGFGDDGAAALSSLTRLRRLGLGNCAVTDSGLLKLSSLGALTQLDLDSCHVSDLGCRVLAHMPLLQHLNLADTNIQDPTLELLAELAATALARNRQYGQKHDVKRQYSVPVPVPDGGGAGGTARGGRQYGGDTGGLSAFVQLSRSQSCGGTGAGGTGAGGGTGGGGSGDDGGLPLLRWLSLSYTQVTAAGVAHLKALTNLTHLNIDSDNLQDSAVLHLTALTRLTCLEGFSARVHEAGAAAIAQLTGLRRLELCGGGLADSACVHLSRLTLLTSLSLAHNPRLSDPGVCLLASSLPQLEDLNLSSTGLTNRAVQELGQLQQLRVLALCNTRVGAGAVQELKGKLPRSCLVKHCPRAG